LSRGNWVREANRKKQPEAGRTSAIKKRRRVRETGILNSCNIG